MLLYFCFKIILKLKEEITLGFLWAERTVFWKHSVKIKDLKLHFIFHQTFKTKSSDDFDSSMLNTFNSNRFFFSPNVSNYKTVLSLYSSSESALPLLLCLLCLNDTISGLSKGRHAWYKYMFITVESFSESSKVFFFQLMFSITLAALKMLVLLITCTFLLVMFLFL